MLLFVLAMVLVASISGIARAQAIDPFLGVPLNSVNIFTGQPFSEVRIVLAEFNPGIDGNCMIVAAVPTKPQGNETGLALFNPGVDSNGFMTAGFSQ